MARVRGALRLKRVYEAPDESDGLRILVDRLWPRGIAKEKAHIDLWLKDVAPSNDLRRRFHGKPGAWKEFTAAYAKELAREPALSLAAAIEGNLADTAVTLLYAARDTEHNNAVALRDWLLSRRHNT
ncbi:MAG: DUF488 family protein [Alphaproteobacteria bacterium]|nr:DUF488 family protein [Alphaproteobacteria bacterium]MDE2629607.1 DUF488 family protein [Alphaproteobacteria bacterium]